MGKRLLFILAIFILMVVGIPSVFAATTINQADFDSAKGGTPSNGVSYTEAGGHKFYSLTADGEFILGEDLALGDAFLDSNNNTIDLNGHLIANDEVFGEAMLINAYDKDLTLKGTGTLSRDVTVAGGTLTVNDDITFNGAVVISDGTESGTAVINDGKFNAGMRSANSVVTIKGGTFKGSEMGAALSLSGSTTTISGGTFSATAASAAYIEGGETTIENAKFTSDGDNGIEVMDDSTKLTIKSGTFTGLMSGITLMDKPTVKLSGGTFKATGNAAGAGAIRIIEGTMDALLATDYKFTASSDTNTVDAIKVMKVKENSVVTTKEEETPKKESSKKEKTPNTGDNIIVSIITLSISVIGLVAISIKKRLFN